MDEQVESTSATVLRDQLALDRTALANERTLLSYVRTALALIAMGAGAVGIFDYPWLIVPGWVAIVIGCVTLVIGAHRYRVMRRRLLNRHARST